MRKVTKSLLAVASIVMLLSSCASYQRTVADSNSRVNFTPRDWTITAPYGAEATVTKILGIDWARLFTKRTGTVGTVSSFSIPIVGAFITPTSADQYAMYDLLYRHPNFDAIFYPQFKRKHFNFLFFYSRSKSQVTARLGKLNTGNGAGDKESDGEGDK